MTDWLIDIIPYHKYWHQKHPGKVIFIVISYTFYKRFSIKSNFLPFFCLKIRRRQSELTLRAERVLFKCRRDDELAQQEVNGRSHSQPAQKPNKRQMNWTSKWQQSQSDGVSAFFIQHLNWQKIYSLYIAFFVVLL